MTIAVRRRTNLVALAFAIGAVALGAVASAAIPTGAGAVSGPQSPPTFAPSSVDTATTALSFTGTYTCDGAGSAGWRAHSFIVGDGVDLSKLDFTGGSSGVPGYIGLDQDAADGVVAFPLTLEGSAVVDLVPAETPKGQINSSALSGIDFNPDDGWGLVDGDYQIGFACTSAGNVLTQWWSVPVTIDADGTPNPFLTVAADPDPEPSTTVLTSDPAASTVGTAVTFTATVTPSGAAGTVAFFVDDVSQTTTTVTGGQATFTTIALATGDRSIRANFTPDDPSSFDPSVGTVSHVVSAAGVGAQATSVELTVDPQPQAAAGDSVTVTATVTPASAVGQIAFAIDGIALGDPISVVGGMAHTSTAPLAAGNRSLSATFAPRDPQVFQSSAATLLYVVASGAGPVVDPMTTADASLATAAPPGASGSVQVAGTSVQSSSNAGSAGATLPETGLALGLAGIGLVLVYVGRIVCLLGRSSSVPHRR